MYNLRSKSCTSTSLPVQRAYKNSQPPDNVSYFRPTMRLPITGAQQIVQYKFPMNSISVNLVIATCAFLKFPTSRTIYAIFGCYVQVIDASLCNKEHGAGETPLTKPDMCSQFHFTVAGRPHKLTFLIHIPPKGAPSIPNSIGAFLEPKLTTFVISIRFILGRAFRSQPSSGWSSAPRLNLNGTLTFSITTFVIVMFSIYPPLPLSVLIRIPAAEFRMWRLSTLMFEIPPDISLPIPTPEHVGVVPETRRMMMLELGRAMEMPYWSHPLFTATRSSPLSM